MIHLAGVDSNSVLRLKGRGDAGRFGGASGDAYVSFVIRERPDISRRGINMHSQVRLVNARLLQSFAIDQPVRFLHLRRRQLIRVMMIIYYDVACVACLCVGCSIPATTKTSSALGAGDGVFGRVHLT